MNTKKDKIEKMVLITCIYLCYRSKICMVINMKLFKRENYLKKIRGFYDATDLIKVITGVRRCGKSSLMLTIAEELVDRGVSEDNIIYIDDYRK